MKKLFLALLSLALAGSLHAQAAGGALGSANVQVAGGTVSSEDGIVIVGVSARGNTVAALSGTVTFTNSAGLTVSIDIGSGLILNADGTTSKTTLKDIIAYDAANGLSNNPNSATAALAQAVERFSAQVKAGAVQGSTATTMLVALVKVASDANPSAAASYVGIAVDAATSSTSRVDNKENALRAIAEAAGGAVDPTNYASIRDAATNAAKANGVDTPLTSTYGITANQSATRSVWNLNAFTSSTPITPIDPAMVSPSGGKK